MATASYPPPPPYYRLYKDLLESPKSAPEPPPPIQGPYVLYGASYTTDDVLPSLEDQGVRPLYPKGPNVGGNRVPYPPCDYCSCTGDSCAGHGYFPPSVKKYSWPELIDVDAEVAKAQIERDNPYVTVVIRKGFALEVVCCNRVWIHVDAHGKVRAPAPRVG